MTARGAANHLMPIALYASALAAALGVGWLLMAQAGHAGLAIYAQTFAKVFLTWRGLSECLVQATPITMGALAVAMAARLNLWNIGVEGQFMLGAFAATGVALALPGQPAWLLIPLMGAAGFISGGLLAGLCGLMRARLGINEIVTTLLFNYVVGLWVGYWVHGPWKAPGSNVPETAEIAASAQLPVLFPGTRVHLGLLIMLACAGLCHLFHHRTLWGYRVRAAADNPRAARTAGIRFAPSVLLVMLLSGGLAGAGGMLEISGAIHRLQDGASPFFTMTVFMVAWIARLNLAGMVVTGFLIAGLQVGGYYMQFQGLPSAMVSLIEGVVLFALIALEPLRKRMQSRGQGGE